MTISDPATPSGACVRGVCGSFNIISSSNCGELGVCVYVTDANGYGTCTSNKISDSSSFPLTLHFRDDH